ncbi:AAA family ATPase [Winogradskyella sp.]|jgi:tRNA uridine 5-carbamoylmethylation protein Kti12|uniref:TrmB family transcriptional regulator sugar-binding domain-containing protein n=1 Tax=Winogradskyella sp. TaxID=1883156 RepID=UPI0025DD8CC1|nr:AAA family ATPase [Winogradskyella sp.]MCT4628822.1 KTI12 family protein [Winogradskyella sp.]
MIINFINRIKTGLIDYLTDDCLKYIASRNEYLNEINNQILLTSSSCYLCVNTLDSADENQSIRNLQENLLNQSNRGVEVKVLVSSINERYEGAYEMITKGIELKFVSGNIGQHLNFTLFNNEHSVFALKKEKQKSKNALLVNDSALNYALTKTFLNVWSNRRSLSFNEFLISKKNELSSFDLDYRIEIPKMFKITEAYLDQILNAFPKYIFLIGRPGSGKSEIANELFEYLQELNYQKESIGYIDDYNILHDWSKDINIIGIEHHEPDGFIVTENDIYNRCELELINRIDNSENEILIVEFSRNVYYDFYRSLLSKNIMKKSLIFYLNTSVKTCLQRNINRKYSGQIPTKYVPENIIKDFYENDDSEILEEEFPDYVNIIDGEKHLDDVKQDLRRLINRKISKIVK